VNGSQISHDRPGGRPTMPIVLLTDPIDSVAIAPLKAIATVVTLGEPGFETFDRAMPKAEVVIVRRNIPPETLASATRLRALIRNGVGLDFIPVELASRQGIAVVNTPGVNARSVAEASIGLMLAGFRGLAHKDRMIRVGQWQDLRQAAFHEREISGMKLGLVGYGAIAREIARIAHFGFGMEVSAVSRSGHTETAIARATNLDDVLSSSDVIILACPLNDQTRGMIDGAALARMKRGAALINIARGPVVDEAALIAALRTKHLAFAALDVFDQQPPHAQNPLLALENVVMSPHTAGITREAMRRMSDLSVEEAMRVLKLERPINLVNPDAWEQITARWHGR